MYYSFKRILHYGFISLLATLVAFLISDRFITPLPLSLTVLYCFTALGCIFFLILYFCHTQQQSSKSQQRVTKGTQLVTPQEFNRLIDGDGLGIPSIIEPTLFQQFLGAKPREEYLRIRSRDEAQHLLICGDSGTGKSAIQHRIIQQIAERGDNRAIIYDPSLEFWEHHGKTTDILLHPLAANCPYWHVAQEINNELDATALAKSFIPNRVEGRPEFWETAPQRLLAFLFLRLKEENKGIPQLLRWLADDEQLVSMVAGTELQPLISPDSPGQRTGVLSSLNVIADALKLLPPDDGRPHFSFTKWTKARPGFIFIATQGSGERDGLRPLLSAWLDLAFARLMTTKSAPPTFVMIDELPSLQRLPSLKTAMHEARKYNTRFCVGFQGRTQLEALYGREAEALMSAPSTRLFFRTNEFAGASFCSKNIGMPETERDVESYTSALIGGGRDSVSVRTETKSDYLVYPNELQNLENLTGYFRYDKYAVKIKFSYPQLEKRNNFVERVRNGKLVYNA